MNTETTASSPQKILVVDDNVIIQQTVALALSKAHYKVTIAVDITEALGAIRREVPDLMLLDISFPHDTAGVCGPPRDGIFVIQWFQRMPEVERIPIIVISWSDPLKFKDQISPQGIIAWFKKPLKHDELLKTIQAALAKRPANQPSVPTP
jgi:CheY-like chemotaxis protein